MPVQFCDQTSHEGSDPSYAYHSEQKKERSIQANTLGIWVLGVICSYERIENVSRLFKTYQTDSQKKLVVLGVSDGVILHGKISAQPHTTLCIQFLD